MTATRSALLPLLLFCLLLVPDLLWAQRGGGREIRTGPWSTKAHIPDGWIRYRTPHYEVQSEAGLEKAKRLGAHMEAMLRFYLRTFRPGKAFTKRYTIKLFKSRETFYGYGAPRGAGAYYSFTDREMVCFDTGKWMDEEEEQQPVTGKGEPVRDLEALRRRHQMDILGAAAHEGWHQFFHWYVVSLVPLPSWINEGMAEYFYCARPKKVKGKKATAELGRMHNMRLPTIKWAVKNGKHVPLKEFLTYTQREYYRNAGICYAQGWSLCHFLQQSENKKYKKIIPRFIKLVKDDTNMKVVTRKAFKGIDLAKLEAEWKTWVEGLSKKPSGKPVKSRN